MATQHLTNDNGLAVREDANHLAGIGKTANHLVVVKQSSKWTDKEFVVTPKEKKFVWADAWGKENSQSQSQQSAAVKGDTDALVNLANARLNAAAWTTGDKAVFAHFTRSYDLRCLYAGTSYANQYAGICRSAVALKFDFRHLHFSKLTSYKVYLRAHQPSLLVRRAEQPGGAAGAGTLFAGALHSGASKLCARFADELPENGTGVSDSTSCEWEMSGSAGNCNGGRTVSADTETFDVSTYDPFGLFAARPNNCQYSRCCVYDRNNAAFHYDFEVTGTQKNFFAKNPGECWLLCEFKRANGFSAGQGTATLYPAAGVTAFVQRVEIVLKCTGEKFNA